MYHAGDGSVQSRVQNGLLNSGFINLLINLLNLPYFRFLTFILWFDMGY
jgi:hypothetical protein